MYEKFHTTMKKIASFILFITSRFEKKINFMLLKIQKLPQFEMTDLITQLGTLITLLTCHSFVRHTLSETENFKF